jgi:anti-sigma factor RsiW
MDHQQARDLLSEFLEGDLPAERATALRAHLEGCEACREELETLRNTLQSLSGLHDLPAPAQFSSRVEHTIRRRSRGRFFGDQPLWGRFPFEWISFVIIVALLVLYLFIMFEKKSVTAPGAPPAPTAGPRPE